MLSITAALLAALLAATVVLVVAGPQPSTRRRPGLGHPTDQNQRRRSLLGALRARLRRDRKGQQRQRQQLLRQLAALLRAGRHNQHLWEELRQVYGRSEKDRDDQLAELVERASVLSARGESPAAAFEQSWPWLACCFTMAADRGVQLADVLERYSAHLEQDQSLDELIVVEAAGAKMTQRLLLLLPFGGIGLSLLLGIDVVGIYFGHPLGLACLLLGAVLSVLAARTSRRIITEAGRRQ